LLSVVGLIPSGSSTVHFYTQTIYRTTQLIWEESGPCPVSASYNLTFALQLREKHLEKPHPDLIKITGRMCINRETIFFTILFKLKRLLIIY